MREDLHELIDGDLPDEQAAELLHMLSVDPEKRSLFRQQMVLQRDLYRNDCFGRLSANEEGEMLDRISRSVGVEQGESIGRVTRRGVLMLAVGFIVGSGAGYLGHGLVGKESMASRPDTAQVLTPAATDANQVAFDRDSAVIAIRDSVTAAVKDSIDSVSRLAPRKTGVSTPPARKKVTGGTNDLTGRPEARKKARR